MSVAQDLEFVTGDPTTRMTKDNTAFYHVPEYCGDCGSRMRIKTGWHITGYDHATGKPDRYSATLYCSKIKPFRFSNYKHDMRELVFTPAEFSIWTKTATKDLKGKNGLSVLTLVRMGI